MAASFSFGSFGDIITICQLVKAGVDALDEASGSAVDYQALKTLLSNVAYVLFKLKSLSETKRITEAGMLNMTLGDCFKTLKTFLDKIQKYDSSLGSDSSKSWLTSSYKKIRWPSMKADVSAFHDEMAMYLAMLQLLLQGTTFDIREADKEELYKRLDEGQSAENLRFAQAEQTMATGFSSQRLMLDRILETVQSLGSAGISSREILKTAEIHKLEQNATTAITRISWSYSPSESWHEATALCLTKVRYLVQSYHRSNSCYVDEYFNLERDASLGLRDCLDNLVGDGSNFKPGSSLPIKTIFQNPQFFIETCNMRGVESPLPQSSSFSSAVVAVNSVPGLLEKVCSGRDEEVGIYGFVFHKDGQWISQIVDSQLYLDKPLWHPSFVNDPFVRRMTRNGRYQNPEEFYRRIFLTDSQSLYFSSSLEPSETWPSLLEKAYAKAHGDYASIAKLFIGDVLEDLTGGATFEVNTSEILGYDSFWKQRLIPAGSSAIVIAMIPGNTASEDPISTDPRWDTAIVKKVEETNGKRMVCLISSAIQQSDLRIKGSRERTSEYLGTTNDDGGDHEMFWMTYMEFIQCFPILLDHHIFSDEWMVAQQWTTVRSHWANEYLDEGFRVTFDSTDCEEIEVNLVLSQLDNSYFRGLGGIYEFELRFAIHLDEDGQMNRIAKTPPRKFSNRSNSMALKLPSNQALFVLPQVITTKLPASHDISNVIAKNGTSRREKLLQVASSYDLAHAPIPGWREKSDMIRQEQEDASKENSQDTVTDPGGNANTSFPVKRQETLGLQDWNALCALGLRVYSKGAVAKIEWQALHTSADDVPSGSEGPSDPVVVA